MDCSVRMHLVLDAKRRLKRGLMQQLLTGKRRLKGSRAGSWVERRLGELFTERTETGRADLPLLAITSDCGVIPRDQVRNRKDSSAENKSSYLRIAPGDIGYNTMRMWQGVSAISGLEGIVSPAYTVCVPGPQLLGRYAGQLFKLPAMIHTFWRHSQGLVDDP